MGGGKGWKIHGVGRVRVGKGVRVMGVGREKGWKVHGVGKGVRV
jgi:hypothetical protein